ncbi:MAG: flagellar basal body-associated FliL family protein [Campylobacterota bacterium]|nr:flagellar basal body-associated FliL family protein [Campylobacterota bacterium]
MADEEEVSEKKGGGNGMMIVLIVLIVLLIGAVGGIGYFLYSKGMFDPEGQQKTEQSQQAEKKEQKDDIEDEGENFLAQIDGLVLNITDAKGRAKLMKLSFTLKTKEPTIATIVEANKAQLIDAVIRQISARSSEELLTVGGKAMLKEEMLEEINNIINDATNEEDVKRDSVKDIFFTSFVIK